LNRKAGVNTYTLSIAIQMIARNIYKNSTLKGRREVKKSTMSKKSRSIRKESKLTRKTISSIFPKNITTPRNVTETMNTLYELNAYLNESLICFLVDLNRAKAPRMKKDDTNVIKNNE